MTALEFKTALVTIGYNHGLNSGLSQTDIAKILGLSIVTINSYCRDRYTISKTAEYSMLYLIDNGLPSQYPKGEKIKS